MIHAVSINPFMYCFSPSFECHMFKKPRQIEWKINTVDTLSVQLFIHLTCSVYVKPEEIICRWILVKLLKLIETKIAFAVGLTKGEECFNFLAIHFNTV